MGRTGKMVKTRPTVWTARGATAEVLSRVVSEVTEDMEDVLEGPVKEHDAGKSN